MRLENLYSRGKFHEASSVQIIWDGIICSSDIRPLIRIECSEDGINTTFLKNIGIETNSNKDDITTLVITQLFRYIRFIYSAGSADSGNVSININYR